MQCPQCGGVAGLDDNFCPGCGVTLRHQRMPAVRERIELVPRDTLTSGLLKQAAVLAAGAMLPILLRSVARIALTGRVRSAAPGRIRIFDGHDGSAPLEIETHSVIELHTTRNIHFRR